MKKFTYTLLAVLFACASAFAQNRIEMADGLRSEGKIYVVVLVMLVIFLAVAVFLFTIDKKVRKLEKDK